MNKEHITNLGKRAGEWKRKFNQYDLSGEYGIGLTYNTNKEFYFDIEDYDKIKDYCWFETDKGYIQTNTKTGNKVDGRGNLKLHRLITNNEWEIVDHVNRNRADNRKENLRQCTRTQNNTNKELYSNNTSGVMGVGWHKKHQKWQVTININKKHKYLGIFIDKEEAIRVRLQAEADYYGEFAPQRHLFEKYNIKVSA